MKTRSKVAAGGVAGVVAAAAIGLAAARSGPRHVPTSSGPVPHAHDKCRAPFLRPDGRPIPGSNAERIRNGCPQWAPEKRGTNR